jgi:phosphatidylserine decarboxylase
MVFFIEPLIISFIVSFSFGYWMAWKTNMKIVQGTIIAVVSGFGSFLLIALIHLYLIGLSILLMIPIAMIAVVIFSGLFLLYRFYRDPERKLPENDKIAVSPADGRIIYIREIQKGKIPISIKGRSNIALSDLAKTNILNEDAYLIGIMMTLFDVHVTRAPIAGKVILNSHYSGKFLSLKNSAAITENERNIIVLKSGSLLAAIVQIASKQVRRIVSYITEGDDVQLGERVGAILLGSQVDVVLPKQGVTILVKEDQQVYAGETILARFDDGWR